MSPLTCSALSGFMHYLQLLYFDTSELPLSLQLSFVTAIGDQMYGFDF